MNAERVRGSRHEYEPTTTKCPEGCSKTDPRGGMRRVTHHTGEFEVVEHHGDVVSYERIETHLECGVCGRVIDQ